MTVHTEAVQFKADQKLLDFIQERIGRMESLFDRIIDARVILRLENAGQIKDKIAEIQLNVPGHTLFVRETSRTFEAAVDGSVAALKRQLKQYKDRKAERRQ